MKRSSTLGLWNSARIMVIATMLAVLAGCGGDDGAQGPQGLPGATGSTGPTGLPGNVPPSATALNIVVNSVTINSAPVVKFTVTNENNVAFPGITDKDLRFNIAKLMLPGTSGDSSTWQNYIVRSSSGAMQGSQERADTRTPPRYPLGTLVDHGDGTYTYTFDTDIRTVSATCPAPCTAADGTPLNLTYDPSLTHRVGIQQGNSSLPQANSLCDFVPSTGTSCVDPAAGTIASREIIQTANCNECHDKITAHGSRFETRLCVTCHNPGSWVDSTTPVDFKVMVHKIHRGEDLPSGGGYAIGNHDFSDVKFPQDIRNCTKCHDGSDPATPQGDNWQTPNLAACGSCHDDIIFSGPSLNHPGGSVTSTSDCSTGCHQAGGWAGSVAVSHTVPGKAERAFFAYNILEICGTAAGSDPSCPPGTNPTVKFSVTDPNGTTSHQYDGLGYGNAYNVLPTSTDPEYATGSVARLTLDIAWDTRDYTNEGGIGTRPARADQINLLTSTAVTDNLDGSFTYTGVPTSTTELIPVIPATSGSGAMALEGRAAADDGTGAFTVRVPVNSPVEYFAITDSTPQPRRQVVLATTKCDRCHDVLSAHGGSRNNNGQLCVMCHNPSNTDVGHHNSGTQLDPITGLPLVNPLDGKTEESIDFKRMIHGIHAASSSNFDGTQAHGFREQGVILAGTDFSDVRFPGVLSKCETCHLPNTYTLADRSASGGGNWDYPVLLGGIRGSTVNTYPNAASDGSDFTAQLVDQTDDWKYSPIASACSACHDGKLSKAHMSQNGAVFGGPGTTQDDLETAALAGNFEGCPVCHGPGRLADVKLVHDQAFANFLGEFIP